MHQFLHTMHAKGETSLTRFVNDQESLFWVKARRNKLLAEWFSSLTDANEQVYLGLLLDESFAQRATPEAEAFILTKIRNDLLGYGVRLTLDQIREVADGFTQRAWAQRNGLSDNNQKAPA